MSLRMAAQCPSGLSTVVLFVLNLVSMHETCYCNQECALGHAVLPLPPVRAPALVLRHDGIGHDASAMAPAPRTCEPLDYRQRAVV